MASKKPNGQTTLDAYNPGRVDVLLVEDSPTDVLLLRELLRDYPLQRFEIEHVQRLDEALSSLTRRSFDVILLDLDLPDSRGIQTVERLVDAAAQVPILILTGAADERLAAEAMHLGIQDYLVKEYSRGHMIGRAVRYAVERRRTQQALQEANEQLQAQTEELQAQAEELQTRTEELRIAKEALEQHEREYRTLTENAPEVIARFDRQLRHTYINEYGARVYGVSRRQVLGRTNAELGMPADKVAFWQARFEEVFATGRQQTVDFEFDSPTFGHQHFSSLFVPEFDTWGQVVSILAITRDVTAARLAQEQLRQRVEEVETLMKVAPVAIWVSNDPQCDGIIGNTAANSFYEACEQENVSANVSPKRRFFRDGQELTPEELPMQEAAAKNIDIHDTELDVLLPSGRWRNMLGSASPLRDAQGQVRGCVGAFVDITERRRALEALRRSEERFHQLFEDDLTGNFVSTPEGRILLCNPAFAAMFGFAAAQEAVGTNIVDLYLDPRERAPLLERLRQEGKIDRFEVWRRRRDGTPIHIVENLVGQFDERGRLYEIKGYLFEDTQRKRTEEQLAQSERHYRLLFETMLQGVVYQGVDGTILSMNPAAERILGKSPTEFLGQTSVSVEHDTVREDGSSFPGLEHPAMVALRTGREVRDVVMGVYNPREGEYRWINIAAVPLFRPGEDKPYQVYTCFNDITDRKQAEETLRELNATLESKVAQRTAQLRHRARQLQKLTLEMSEAEERERQRLAEILHDDLQQQLAGAKFHLGLLSTRLRGEASLHEAATQVTGMLKDAIEKTRSLSHELSPALLYHGDFTEALEWLASRMQTQHGLVVHVEARGLAEISSDPTRAFLFRTAQEILFNIVKHAQVAEATVRLQRRRGRLWLTVSDQGRGFDPHTLEQTAGFGLLSIRERVALLGGRMKIRSVPGRGSTFLVAVPDVETLPQAGAQGADTSVRPKARERLRVLLVDDHEIVREGLALLLDEQEDIEVVGQAANGQEAVDLARRLHPDVVVMDMAMPRMEGHEATRQIKQDMPRTRVVGLSMFEEPDTADKMHQAGAERYMLKTAPAEELLAAIRNG